MARRARWLAAAWLLSALAGVWSCSQPTDTQPHPGACDPFTVLGWTPVPNSEGAPRDVGLRVVFNDYPDPDTLGVGAFLLTTGVFYYTGSYAVDLVGKAIRFQPANLLRGNLGYTMTLLPSLLTLSGCPTDLEQRSFRTGDGLAALPVPEAVPFTAVQALFAQSCAGASCHRAPAEAGGGCLPAPAEGLSLCDADAWDALVGVPAREVTRLALVEPHDSARSYLLRKLLPATRGGGPAPTALGHRDPPGAPLADAELETIARWIDAGAVR